MVDEIRSSVRNRRLDIVSNLSMCQLIIFIFFEWKDGKWLNMCDISNSQQYPGNGGKEQDFPQFREIELSQKRSIHCSLTGKEDQPLGNAALRSQISG